MLRRSLQSPIAWHFVTLILLGFLLWVTPTFTFAASSGATPVKLYRTYSGNVDYVATGASFRSLSNEATPGDNSGCVFVSPMTRSINLNIPANANVKQAFLYFAGSGSNTAPLINTSTQNKLTLNGTSISSSPGLNGENYQITELAGTEVDFFGARRDVTNLVSGPGIYTFAGLKVHTVGDGRFNNETCLGAFSLLVIYEDPNITNTRVINLFDGFSDFQNSTLELEPRNFVVKSGGSGKATHITYEGDETLAAGAGTCTTCDEKFRLSVPTNASPVDLINGLNPRNNQFNNTISGSNVFSSSTNYGLDIDTYDLKSILSSKANAFTAKTYYSAAQDLVLLQAEVFSIDNKNLADIEITLTDNNVFRRNTNNQAIYTYKIKNNGDGSTNSTLGAATGYVHVYNDLPNGISFDKKSDITAPGWNCSASTPSNNRLRCKYKLSSLAGKKLKKNQALPQIKLKVDVGQPSTPVTNIARVSLCAGATDNCISFNGKHNNANQFDPVNYFVNPDDLFDVDKKSNTNNNVDARQTAVISGVASNISTSVKTVKDVNGGLLMAGDIVEFKVTVSETGGADAVIDEVTDALSDKLTDFSYRSQSNCGGTQSFSQNMLLVENFTVPSNSSCTIIFRAKIIATVPAGTSIDNTATIRNNTGPDVIVKSPSKLLSGDASGSKILYLGNLDTIQSLSRTQAGSSQVQVDKNNSSIAILQPILAAKLKIRAGVIPVSVWVEATQSGSHSLTAELSYGKGQNFKSIGSQTVSNLNFLAGINNAQLVPFQIKLSSQINDLDKNETIKLTILNNAASQSKVRLHSKLNALNSSVIVDASTVINVDSIKFFSDAARTKTVTTTDSGTKIYVEAKISDPFGAFDVSRAMISIIDPMLTNQRLNVDMTEVSAVGAVKTYVYEYAIPNSSTINPGTWFFRVKALEGMENTISHTDTKSIKVTKPAVAVTYKVSPKRAVSGELLTYVYQLNNTGSSPTVVKISEFLPNQTGGLNILTLGGGTNNSNANKIVIDDIQVPVGKTTISFTVNVLTATPDGTMINHAITTQPLGSNLRVDAPSVVLNAFNIAGGNKPLYLDNLTNGPLLDRTVPTNDTNLQLTSKGGETTLTLTPVLQSQLELAAGDIKAGFWFSRNVAATGERSVRVTLGYAGASSGTIGVKNLALHLGQGSINAQFIPVNFPLANDLVLPENTSLTLTINNRTNTSNRPITLHNFVDDIHPSVVMLNAITPLVITKIENLNLSTDDGGIALPAAAPNKDAYIRATVSDPFGREDITSALLSLTDPDGNLVLDKVAMTIPDTQPTVASERFFEYKHSFAEQEGNWQLEVSANEGFENLVSTTKTSALLVADTAAKFTTSFKSVLNTTTNDNAKTRPGDVLRYTLDIVATNDSPVTNVDIEDGIPKGTRYVVDSLRLNDVPQAKPNASIQLENLTFAANETKIITFEVTVKSNLKPGALISNTATITSPSSSISTVTITSDDLLVTGSDASGTKVIYFESLNTTPKLHRTKPSQTGLADTIVLPGGSGQVNIDLKPGLAKAITIQSGTIPIALRVAKGKGGTSIKGNRSITATLSYLSAGSATPIGSDTITINARGTNDIRTAAFSISNPNNIDLKAGQTLRLTLTNNELSRRRGMRIFSHDKNLMFSTIKINPTPVIHVDEISFWTDTMGAGQQVTNPNPDGATLDVYAKIKISDPFGDYDIQAPDAATNPSTVAVINPDKNISISSDQNCAAPCYVYSGEDTTNDVPGNASRTFYYKIRLAAIPNANRGLWQVKVVANEGLEIGEISHSSVASFSTASESNLSTSTKVAVYSGDVDPGDNFDYVITLINSGSQTATQVRVVDKLQTTPVALTYQSATSTCLNSGSIITPVHMLGTVTVENIGVPANSSCTVTIRVSVGNATPGQLIDNAADIINPNGTDGTPIANTIVVSESKILVVGSKQLYLANLLSNKILTRTPPSSTSFVQIDSQGGALTLNLSSMTTSAMTIKSGIAQVDLWVSQLGASNQRTVEIEALLNSGGGFVSLGSTTKSFSVSGIAKLQSFVFNIASDQLVPTGSRIRLKVTNSTTSAGEILLLEQKVVGKKSQLILPVTNSLEVTSIKLFDQSASANAGCAPSCGQEVVASNTAGAGQLWARAIIRDAFGAFDVNTGCVSGATANCPLLGLQDPTGADKTPTTDANKFLPTHDVNTTERQFEIRIDTLLDVFSGDWQLDVTGYEGTEQVISHKASLTFNSDGLGSPELTIDKRYTGDAKPGEIITYINDVVNNGNAAAQDIALTNEISEFLELEVIAVSNKWTAVLTLSSGFTVQAEAFDSGDGSYSYAPNVNCGAPTPANSPCYDSNITSFKINLNESVPATGGFTEQYRARISL